MGEHLPFDAGAEMMHGPAVALRDNRVGAKRLKLVLQAAAPFEAAGDHLRTALVAPQKHRAAVGSALRVRPVENRARLHRQWRSLTRAQQAVSLKLGVTFVQPPLGKR